MSNDSVQISEEHFVEQYRMKAIIEKYLGMILHHLGRQNSRPSLWQLHHMLQAIGWLERGRHRFALSAAMNAAAKNVRENPFSNAQANAIAKELDGVSLESLRDAFSLVRRRTFHDHPRVISTGKRIPMFKGYGRT